MFVLLVHLTPLWRKSSAYEVSQSTGGRGRSDAAELGELGAKLIGCRMVIDTITAASIQALRARTCPTSAN